MAAVAGDLLEAVFDRLHVLQRARLPEHEALVERHTTFVFIIVLPDRFSELLASGLGHCARVIKIGFGGDKSEVDLLVGVFGLVDGLDPVLESLVAQTGLDAVH